MEYTIGGVSILPLEYTDDSVKVLKFEYNDGIKVLMLEYIDDCVRARRWNKQSTVFLGIHQWRVGGAQLCPRAMHMAMLAFLMTD